MALSRKQIEAWGRQLGVTFDYLDYTPRRWPREKFEGDGGWMGEWHDDVEPDLIGDVMGYSWQQAVGWLLDSLAPEGTGRIDLW